MSGLCDAVEQARARASAADDPTYPVVILVGRADEARALSLTIGRSGDPRLRLGVEVLPVLDAALRLRSQEPGAAPKGLVAPVDFSDAVRKAAREGYFANLWGRSGVTDALVRALRIWDDADEAIRAEVFRGAFTEADRSRLAAVSELHSRVAQALAADGLLTAGALFAQGPDATRAARWAWVDCVVQANPAQSRWLSGLAEATAARVVAGPSAAAHTPGGSGTRPSVSLVAPADTIASAVDTADEAMWVARGVAAAVAGGVAPRDIVVAVPSGRMAEYSVDVSVHLDAAGIPNNVSPLAGGWLEALRGAGGREHLAASNVGRLVAAVSEAVADMPHQRDLRFDHLRACVLAGRLEVGGVRVRSRALEQVWGYLRGWDPAGWHLLPDSHFAMGACAGGAEGGDVGDGADGEAGTQDVLPAAVAVRSVARALQLLRRAAWGADDEHPTWQQLAAAWGELLSMTKPVSPAEGAASAVVARTLNAWQSRDAATNWQEASAELAAALSVVASSSGGGVRVLPLEAAWAAGAAEVFACALADDIVPGVQGPVGPLTAEEVLRLRTRGARGDVADAWRALRVAVPRLHASFPRSDLSRTVVRSQSRLLGGAAATTVLGSLTSQLDLVDGGAAALLGPADAAAALARTGAPPAAVARLTDRDVAVFAECVVARRTPSVLAELAPPGDVPLVGPYAGDVSSLVAQFPGALTPARQRSDGSAPSASPSSLEKLVLCPAGWWAERLVGVGASEEWDPAAMDPRAWGSWLHAVFERLWTQDRLFARRRTDEAVRATLLAVIGGGAGPVGTQEDDGGALARWVAPESQGSAGPIGPDEDGLHGFRYRVTDQDVERAAEQIASAADRLQQFLAGYGGTVSELDAPVTERPLGPLELPVGDGLSVPLAGRTDRIDDTADGGFVVTDFKTGRAGSGLQLAIYGWLRAMEDGHEGPVRLLYASTSTSTPYQAVELLEDVEGTDFTRAELETFLADRLADSLRLVASGHFPSRAAAGDAHDPYCVLCGDLVASSGWDRSARGERARALKGEDL